MFQYEAMLVFLTSKHTNILQGNFGLWKPTLPENEHGNLTISKDWKGKSCSKSPALLGFNMLIFFQGANLSAQMFFLGSAYWARKLHWQFFMRDCSHRPWTSTKGANFANFREKMLLKSITSKEKTPRNHSTNSNMPWRSKEVKTFRIARKNPCKLWKC